MNVKSILGKIDLGLFKRLFFGGRFVDWTAEVKVLSGVTKIVHWRDASALA
jgi:hypothetical protein